MTGSSRCTARSSRRTGKARPSSIGPWTCGASSRRGLDPDELEEALTSGRYEPVIDQHRADASSVGIDAIPSHVVGGRYLLVGAQPLSIFKEVLAQIGDEGERDEPSGQPPRG